MTMQCPRCFGEDVTAISNSHYVCNNPECFDENHNRTQFRFIEDTRVQFPYNQIFVNQPKSRFYRKPYLKLDTVGVSNVDK